MNISKSKKSEFDNIFKLWNEGNFFIDINLFRNLYVSDFFEHFLFYIDEKINLILKTTDTIILHCDINVLSVQDTYHYDKGIKFAKVLHKYTDNIKKIILYGSSSLTINFIKLINLALKTNIIDKILFSNNMPNTINYNSNEHNK